MKLEALLFALPGSSHYLVWYYLTVPSFLPFEMAICILCQYMLVACNLLFISKRVSIKTLLWVSEKTRLLNSIDCEKLRGSLTKCSLCFDVARSWHGLWSKMLIIWVRMPYIGSGIFIHGLHLVALFVREVEVQACWRSMSLGGELWQFKNSLHLCSLSWFPVCGSR